MIEAWKKEFIRHIRNGYPRTVAATLAKVGLDRVVAESRRDPEFAAAVEDAQVNRRTAPVLS